MSEDTDKKITESKATETKNTKSEEYLLQTINLITSQILKNAQKEMLLEKNENDNEDDNDEEYDDEDEEYDEEDEDDDEDPVAVDILHSLCDIVEKHKHLLGKCPYLREKFGKK